MAKAKGRLQAALAVEKNVDYKKVVEKRKRKDVLKQQKRKAGQVDEKPAKKQKKDAKVEEDDSEDDEDYEEVDEDMEDDDESGSDYDMAELLDREAAESDDEEEDSDEDEGIDLSKFEHDESSSDSEVEMEEKIERPKKAKQSEQPQPKKSALKQTKSKKVEEEDSEEEEDEEDEDIDMEDLEDDLNDDEREDLVPFTRTTINNHTALLAALNRIGLPTDPSVPFATHQCVVSAKPTVESIPDIQDDLQRELAFYAQSLEAAKIGRAALLKEGVPFTRPNDYFAEMVKSDGQMEKVKAKMIEEATAKKLSAEARKQRDLKKFGKQVQVAKEQERAKAKRETLEKIKTLKKKRAEGSGAALGANEADDLFDVAVDNEIKQHDKRTSAGAGGKKRPGAPAGASGAKRQKKDSKYGFGGKKRHSKSGDAASSADMSSFSVKRMKSGGSSGGKGGKGGKAPRLGKSRRNAGAGKK